jgi:hypothetical protein
MQPMAEKKLILSNIGILIQWKVAVTRIRGWQFWIQIIKLNTWTPFLLIGGYSPLWALASLKAASQLEAVIQGFLTIYVLTGMRLSASCPTPNQEVQSQSHVTTDGQSVGLSWCRVPSGAHDQIFIIFWKLQFCQLGAPSLTRGRVCRLSTRRLVWSNDFDLSGMGGPSGNICYRRQ